MLPFLEPKKLGSTIIARRGKNPDLHAETEVEAPGSSIPQDLKEAAEDVLRAIDSKSVLDLAKALRAAFEICDSYPHEEGPHEESEEGEE